MAANRGIAIAQPTLISSNNGESDHWHRRESGGGVGMAAKKKRGGMARK